MTCGISGVIMWTGGRGVAKTFVVLNSWMPQTTIHCALLLSMESEDRHSGINIREVKRSSHILQLTFIICIPCNQRRRIRQPVEQLIRIVNPIR
jgi:hypothetical protein